MATGEKGKELLSYVPVSYTHLDVYKRQDMKKPEHALKAFIRFALAQGAITVSYTHLDVYKRQVKILALKQQSLGV